MSGLDFTPAYAGGRMPVLARNLVATSQPLAAQAGVAALRDGGNAADAALAMAIALTVVEPTSNGIGGDAFALVWDGEKLHGLNASGRSPAAASLDDYAGLAEMPLRGWGAVTVPGCVGGWVELSKKFGKLPFAKLFDAAISYARDGFAVAPRTAAAWAEAAEIFRGVKSFAPFLPGGVAPAAGETFSFPEQADTLEEIAASGGESFYRGALAKKIAAAARADGAKLSLEDLASHRCEWVKPLAKKYRSRGHGEVELHELPPNGQGLAALLMLGIAERRGVGDCELDAPDFFHLQIEAMKLAFADARRYIADPAHLEFPPELLLEDEYLDSRAALIDMHRAGAPAPGTPNAEHARRVMQSGTVYLTAADQHGMMVSFIQSNFWGFGSGVVVPGTGISLQNRGAGFCLQPGHPNCFAGGKLPYHTIIPGMLTQRGRALMSFGVMGGAMQPQGHAQMVIRVCDHCQNPQSASDAPRWQVMEDGAVALEPGIARDVRDELTRRGHRLHAGDLHAALPLGGMGGAQLIYKTDGGYVGGSDHRKDGMAAGY